VLYLCPGCQRTFDETGFCPFDRTRLVPMSEARTVVTGPMRAQVGPHTTAVEPHDTVPDPEVAADPDYDKLVGQMLDGRYHVQKKIGEGGMGVVFAARHAVIERPLAIKVLKREVMRDTATIRRFVQEAKAASRIGHPNIVDVTDFGTTPDGMTYSVMEYVSGQTLGAALRHDAPLPMPRAVRIAAQIARALGAAHDKGIVHRDLKPENVFLVDRDGRPDFVKIVDFGIAKVAPLPGQSSNEPRLTRAGSVFGTPEYMAPEQAAGRVDTDGRVDIYALGVILYEMVTGRVPHKGDSMVRTLAMQMLDPALPPSKVRPDLAISPELEALILTALAKKREQRFQTMGELLAALDGLQTPVGLSVTGSPVYALVSLPPGAAMPVPVTPAPVAAAVPSPVPATPLPVPVPTTPVPGLAPQEKPITLEHTAPGVRGPGERRTWPVLLLFALILGGAAGALALVLASRSRVVAEVPTAPSPSPPLAVDAAAAALAADAVEPRDAAVRLAMLPRDAAAAVPDPPPSDRPPVEIQVLTKPEGATLHVGGSYRGPGGTRLREPYGTRLTVTCKHLGYKDGVVRLVFDGKREAELCVLERIVVCIPNVKNPFDKCPD
jgi:tRNA A-37 threonylcarbamoyl transferase component Bud32